MMEAIRGAKLRWGIIGPGSIAREFADALRLSPTSELVAIATRDPGKPGLAENFPSARIIEGYQAILGDPSVDAIYVATPHNSHAEWSVKAAAAGKHVLVEKPMAVTAAEAEAMFSAARQAGVFMGEAFMYRLHPMTAKIGELVASGIIGEVRMIQSSFGIEMDEYKPDHRLFSKELAGGGILDVGCYPISMVRFVAGAAIGKPFLDPLTVSGRAHVGPEGVDEWSTTMLTFENGIIAQVSCAIRVALDNTLRVHGSTGWLEARNFWSAGTEADGGRGRIDIVREEGPRKSIFTEGSDRLYLFEIEAMGQAIAVGRHEFASPGMSWADSLGNMRTLDRWRADAGI
jgi:predicted dehydrogenase